MNELYIGNFSFKICFLFFLGIGFQKIKKQQKLFFLGDGYLKLKYNLYCESLSRDFPVPTVTRQIQLLFRDLTALNLLNSL